MSYRGPVLRLVFEDTPQLQQQEQQHWNSKRSTDSILENCVSQPTKFVNRLTERFGSISKNEMIIRYAKTDWIVCTHCIQKGREQWQCMPIIGTGEKCNPLIGLFTLGWWSIHRLAETGQ